MAKQADRVDQVAHRIVQGIRCLFTRETTLAALQEQIREELEALTSEEPP